MSLNRDLISTPENRTKLLKLADNVKTRKKSVKSSQLWSKNSVNNHSESDAQSNTTSSQQSSQSSQSSQSLTNKTYRYDLSFTNIEHLVFGTYRQTPSTPSSPIMTSTSAPIMPFNAITNSTTTATISTITSSSHESANHSNHELFDELNNDYYDFKQKIKQMFISEQQFFANNNNNNNRVNNKFDKLVDKYLDEYYDMKRSRSHPQHIDNQTQSNLLKQSLSDCELINNDDDNNEYDDSVDNVCDNRANHTYAEALWDHTATDCEELSFVAGEVIDVSDCHDKHWWWGSVASGGGRSGARCGWFPSSFVRTRVSQHEPSNDTEISETSDELSSNCQLESINNNVIAINTTESDEKRKQTDTTEATVRETPKKRLSISKLSNEQIRANIVLEIVHTERDFVKHLNDVIEGYIKPCRECVDMFTDELVSNIFANIEQIYSFQRNFLDCLETVIDWHHISESAIGDCFLKFETEFSIYCDYCNNHPLAVSELQELYSQQEYVLFFENCRRNQNMIDISLDGFLLTPIQKICKYPLQLAELFKYTRSDHLDYTAAQNALEAMKRVAQLVNERKRRFERLEQLIAIEQSMEGWQGLPLLDTSSILIYSSDVTRLYANNRSREYTLFLFDHLMICCKKDSGGLLKREQRTSYLYKARIDMDSVSDIVDIVDGSREPDYGLIKNGFKLKSRAKQKWIIFQAKTPVDKINWIKALHDERQLISEDRRQGFVVTSADKRVAQLAYLSSVKPKKPRAKLSSRATKPRPDTAIAEIALEPTFGSENDRNRSSSLPSYIHNNDHNDAHSIKNLTNLKQSTIKKKASASGSGSGSGWFNLGSTRKYKSRAKRGQR